MDYQQKIILSVTVLLVALAVYFAVTAEKGAPGPEEKDTTYESLSLLIKGLGMGKGYSDYEYSYQDISNDYVVEYQLTKKGNDSMISISNPLSEKTVYLMENDTVLCIEYFGEQGCSSVKNNPDIRNYLESLEVKFFDDARIQGDVSDIKSLFSEGYLSFDQGIVEKPGCSEVGYTLDFTGITLDQAARYGIGSTSPKTFNWTVCIDNETGFIHRKDFIYSYEGIQHESQYVLISLKKDAAGDIVPPQNLTAGAVDILRKEREQSVKLAKCYVEKEGDEREKCVASLATELRKTGICSLAGGRKDRCLVSLVPVLRDEGICPMVTDPSFRDDCYIELAGSYKNETYCGNVVDLEKHDYCLEVAVPNENEPEKQEIEVSDLLDIIEKSGSEGNGTNSSSG